MSVSWKRPTSSETMSSRFFVSLIHPAANGVYRALRDAVPLAIDDAWGSLARAAEGEAMIFACSIQFLRAISCLRFWVNSTF